MSIMGKTFNDCFWNVRGLGDQKKCNEILAKLLSSSSQIILLQETKLSEITDAKLFSFFPRNLHAYHSIPSSGVAGGLLTSWNDAFFNCTDSSSTRSTLTVYLPE